MIMFSDHLCFKTYAVSRYMTGLYKPYLDEISLTYPQYLVMLVLWENGRMNIGKIGDHLHLDNGTLTPLLKRMEKNGLLSRTRSMDDERVVLIDLTDKGKRLKDKAKHIPEAVQKCFHLDEEKKKQLKSVLDEILSTQSTSII
ncbi:MarR family transcriptional regulator [Chryseobacterium joostei]|uniref:DNA-binding transcriptional regulator, MarR family n=1 Tax=Chryseobacterium joostei TaxID=112234 RepID=A0A1N7IQ69_9FLAO|nr:MULTISPECIES: MarR family transcriptional regulator [Chryseobacterium]AZA98361.1 MarR family transcriptional regulator [Chryseobacterium joostei]SIS39234.1 DNA-binding transcriptional regulator, MarR family [Chryseobacterium joostei]HCM35771.1 MarR family transcriptional regulator [Chryseobacterium sp.]